MLDPMSAAIAAALAAVGAGMANEAGKWAWESAGGLVRRIVGREVAAPSGPAELSAVARLVHDGIRDDPALARAWAAFARTAPLPATADGIPALPPSVRFFTDRQEPMRLLEREALRKADGRPRLALIHGPEGIGTSALAVHWGCREAARFPDGQLYADLRGASAGTALDSAVVLRSLLVQLGMDQDDIPPSAADRRAAFRRCAADRRLLVVLDHAHSSAQVRPLVTSAPGVFTVVVARRPLPGLDAVPVPVGPLSDKDARRLLTELAGRQTVAAARATLPRVLERCGGSPYALRAAAPLLSEPEPEPGRVAVAAPLSDPALTRHRTEEDPPVSAHDPVRTAAERTYQGLEPGTARIYRLMSLREWPTLGPAVVAQVAGIPEAEAARSLGALADGQLLELTDTGHFRYRPAIRGHAEETAFRTDGIAACSAAMTGTVRWYLRLAVRARLAALPQAWAIGPLYDELAASAGPYGDEGEALTALRAELGNLVQAVLAAEEFGDPDSVYQLCQALWPLQLKAGHHDEILPALRAGARMVDTHHPGSRMAGRMHVLLALNLMELWQYEEAETHLTAAVRAEEQAGHRRGQASAVESLGLLRLRQWRFAEAYACFDEASAVLDGTGPDDEGARDLPRARALLERHRGRALRGLGRFSEATERLETALGFFRAGADPYNAARTLTDLAETHLAEGRPESALPLIDEATATLDKERAAHHLAHLRALRERCVSAQE
ncbi:tetratricopeptide repeat protein [Streptomyces sp. JV176]|uniref:tetratricopeptide repeat protein n=1 Tax=Streptomyces sp. JV176 TaxID=858630 RepID=UPI002E78525D|nr:tetratricopeptide repeat protein [Streptomyces sp. JV176]MEE1803116.1 tetratricopeptide repeat protein [Streptomyces sp. JV176]